MLIDSPSLTSHASTARDRRTPHAAHVAYAPSCRRAIALVAAMSIANAAQLGAQSGRAGALPPRRQVAIVHATIYTMSDSTPIRDGIVVIGGGRITHVGPLASVEIPADARVIDASGKFVIPGLWDMHVHTAVPGGEPLLGLYLANGVTGVRDMGGDLGVIQDWRKQIRVGKLAGPRIVASGPYLQGGEAALPHFVVLTPADARRAVDSLAKLGADFVKVHELVPRDAYFELARAARARGLALAGHISAGISVEEAADSGQRSLEHLNGFANPCTLSDSTRLAKVHSLHRLVMGECSTTDQTPVYRHIASTRTWVTPTLIALEMAAVLPGPVPADSLARYEPEFLREAMAAALEIPADMPPDANVLGGALYSKRMETVRGLVRSGVPILAGTDAPLPNSIPGFGLHAELEALVRSGLSPWQALRAATIEPARYFASDTMGAICAGCAADLVVLDADPLRDIRNTRRIALVVADGRLYTPAARAALRQKALRAARPAPARNKASR